MLTFNVILSYQGLPMIPRLLEIFFLDFLFQSDRPTHAPGNPFDVKRKKKKWGEDLSVYGVVFVTCQSRMQLCD